MRAFTKRSPSQRIKILAALRKAGKQGLTNVELSEVGGIRWAARIQELYMQGYKVAKETLGDGLVNYVLIHEPDAIDPDPPRALDVLTREIEGKFGGQVTTAQLLHIMESSKLQVGRKPGTFNV